MNPDADFDTLSRTLNAFYGGDPRERFCSRAWRLRWHHPKWFLLVVIIDRHFYRLRGERRHCRTAWTEDLARLDREDAEAMVNAGL